MTHVVQISPVQFMLKLKSWFIGCLALEQLMPFLRLLCELQETNVR
jgi:hypothetical protein